MDDIRWLAIMSLITTVICLTLAYTGTDVQGVVAVGVAAIVLAVLSFHQK